MSRAPACYFAAHDRIPNRILILMEDMAPLRAADQARPLYRLQFNVPPGLSRDCVGQAVGLTAEEAKATIREISKLHAEYWGCAQDKAPHIKTIGETTTPPLADALCMSRFDCDCHDQLSRKNGRTSQLFRLST